MKVKGEEKGHFTNFHSSSTEGRERGTKYVSCNKSKNPILLHQKDQNNDRAFSCDMSPGSEDAPKIGIRFATLSLINKVDMRDQFGSWTYN